MAETLILSLCALVLSLVLTPAVRHVSLRLGFVDAPDGGRKLHPFVVPRTGGVAVLVAYLLSFAAAVGWNGGATLPLAALGVVAPAAIAMFTVGLVDDVRALRPGTKFLLQAAVAALAYVQGLRIERLCGIETGEALGLAVTMVWLVGCSNAFNLIDGVDGLASGVGLVATLTIFLAALLQGNAELAVLTLPLAAALLGFLRFNFNPASIFLGDSGSLLIGFLLGAYGIVWSQKSAALLGLTAPAIALALPLADVGISVARRFLRRRPIFAADRGHIHHRLLDAGLTPRRTALVSYAVCAVAASLSLAYTATQGRYAGLIVVLFCAAAIGAVRVLGYDEFAAACKVAKCDVFRSAVALELITLRLEQRLRTAGSLEECMEVLAQGSPELGFDGAHIERLANPPARRQSRVRVEVDLLEKVKLVFIREGLETENAVATMEALTRVQRVLEQRLRCLEADESLAPSRSMLALAAATSPNAAAPHRHVSVRLTDR